LTIDDAQSVGNVVAALVNCPYLVAGIRPLQSTPPDGPVVEVSSRTASGFVYALGCAESRWAAVDAWELVASDAVLRVGSGSSKGAPLAAILPPGMLRLQAPVQLAVFGDAAAIAAIRRGGQ
jgi:hypothetical protein